MNTSENDSYLDMYDYDSNSTCDQDTSAELFDKGMVLPILYVLFAFGLLGNSTVIWVLLRHIKLKTMTDISLLNLALSDLIMALSLPMWAHDFQSPAICKLMTAIYQLGFYSGTLFVTLMSMDRYLAIVHAVAAMRTRTLRYGVIASIAIWVISIILAAPQVIFASLEIVDNSSQCQPVYPEETYESWKLGRNFTENTVGFFLCLPVIIFCYVKILTVLYRCRNSKKNRAVKLIFTIVCVFVVCWVPYNVAVFLKTLQILGMLSACEAQIKIDSAMSASEIIALCHCCLNPIIYAFVSEKFRKACTGAGGSGSKKSGWTSSQKDTEKETSNTPVRSEY